MAWTTPETAVAGDVLTAAWLNQNVRDNLAEFSGLFTTFTTWTPAVTQATPRTSTDTGSFYVRIGKLVIAWAAVSTIQAGTSGNVISCSLPVRWDNAFLNGSEKALGVGHYYVSGSVTHYPLAVQAADTYPDSTQQRVFFRTSGANNVMGVNPSFATATNDVLSFVVCYMGE